MTETIKSASARAFADEGGISVINIIMLALFVEAIVSAIKPIWKDGGERMSVTEIASIVIGVVLAVALRIDLFSAITDTVMAWETPVWVSYMFYVMSGIAIGRGPSFVYDLWQNMKKWAEDNPLPEARLAETLEMNMNLESWPVARLRRFCESNGIDCTGCVTKDDYVAVIAYGSKPPDESGNN